MAGVNTIPLNLNRYGEKIATTVHALVGNIWSIWYKVRCIGETLIILGAINTTKDSMITGNDDLNNDENSNVSIAKNIDITSTTPIEIIVASNNVTG